MRKTLKERFYDKIMIDDETGCWIWTGGKNPKGYGLISDNGKLRIASRVTWELHRGPIPDGLHVLHDCPHGDNPSCVNPDHLWLGTNAENMADRKRKGGYRRENFNWKSRRAHKVTDEKMTIILESPLSARNLAPLVGISKTHIDRLRRQHREDTCSLMKR